ncbi:hypothetical protein L9F63_019158, partial [Diploptera punctata]
DIKEMERSNGLRCTVTEFVGSYNLALWLESMNALDRKSRSLLRKLYPNMFLRTQKSVHAIIIVEIPKLPAEMSDLKDFDLVFDENNESGFITDNSGSPVIGNLFPN